MQTIQSLEEWQRLRHTLSQDLNIGFVPTMGNLHQGHVTLLARSKRDNDISTASVFINPTQFNNSEDFQHYPKTIEEDIALMKQAGVDYCLCPEASAIYHDNYSYRVEETQQNLILEGVKRPGHFNGVLTVVMKLLNLVKPHRSYFGEKDYQQYVLIRDMVRAFFIDTDIILCPTIREASGLACSSRNNRLNLEERILADKFAKIFHQPKSCEAIKIELTQQGITVDYVEDHEQRRFAAVHIGSVRLIDNYAMK